jgi:3-oxoadipate enol-lactonase
MPYCDVGDTQIYYEVADYTDPWRPADTVVLHHPAMGNLTRWYAWVPHLARHFRVVRFDARGHGNSSPLPPDYVWSIDVLARDVTRLMDHLGVEAAHFAGASAGGIIGIRFAHNHPERIKTLTLVASTARMAETKANYAEWMKTISAEGVEAFLRKDAEQRFAPGTDPGLIDWFAREGGRNQPHVVVGFASHMASLDQRELLARIRCPTLILSAGDDDNTPISTQHYLRDHLPDPEMVVLEGMRHNIQSAAPDRCAREMLAFLARRGYVGG